MSPFGPMYHLVPLSHPSNLFQIWEKTNEIKIYSWMYNILKESILFQKCYRLMRNNHIHECMIYIERIKILHSKLPLRYQLSQTTNSQKLPCQEQKSKLHTTTHNLHTARFHHKFNTTKRFVFLSSLKWLPRIFPTPQNS